MIHLLDAMGLKQHHETFMKERISGEILVECDDQVLEKELKVGLTNYYVHLPPMFANLYFEEYSCHECIPWSKVSLNEHFDE